MLASGPGAWERRVAVTGASLPPPLPSAVDLLIRGGRLCSLPPPAFSMPAAPGRRSCGRRGICTRRAYRCKGHLYAQSSLTHRQHYMAQRHHSHMQLHNSTRMWICVHMCCNPRAPGISRSYVSVAVSSTLPGMPRVTLPHQSLLSLLSCPRWSTARPDLLPLPLQHLLIE